MTLYPVPAGRSSDSLVTQRLLSQLQTGQKRLLQVEQQLGTGRRIQLSSEDPASAGRALTLQRLLEIKDQLQSNLSTSQSYLNATDTALGGVADLLSDARGMAILAADSTTSDLERQALSVEIESVITQMLNVGNQSFRGRYLFAGTESTEIPFDVVNGYIRYSGNDVTYRTLADSDLFFETNVPGQELFGAVSSEVKGIDLNPALSANTQLADLLGGRGITEGSIVVSDGTSSSTISLEGARTLGDVVGLIESQPPAGRELKVTIGASGLTVSIDQAGGGSLIIRDLPGGITAAELGIARDGGLASVPIVGADLDPVLRLTTPVADILGSRATLYARSNGPNNDIMLQAHDRGSVGNGYTLQMVNDHLLQAGAGITAGNEYVQFSATPQAARASVRLSGVNNDLILTANAGGTQWNNVEIRIDASQDRGDAAAVSFDASSNTLLLEVDDSNETTLGTMVAAINASGYFTATPDPSLGEGYDPATQVLAIDAGQVGNTGNSGGDANTIFVHIDPGATRANQVVDALNADPTVSALFEARIDPQDSQNKTLAGTRTVDVEARGITSGGDGIEWDQTSGLQITNGDEQFVIDLSGAETVEDLLNTLNASDAMLLAEINEDRSGINIRSRLSGSDFRIGENGGSTATDLGLRTLSRTTRLSELNYRQGVHAVAGTDFVIHRNDGVDLNIDISSAKTVGDVLDLINNHPDNLDPNSAVAARLTDYGNGIELIDDNPVTGEAITVSRVSGSHVAWELGLVPWGQDSSESVEPPAQAASAQVAFAAPHDTNTALQFMAAQAGTGLNDIAIEFRNTLIGDVANVTFDAAGDRLIIDMADGQTTANTVLNAINLEGTFTAQLDITSDPSNDGTGTLVAPLGAAATTAGGTAEVFVSADSNPIETEGIFNTLLRLRDAVDANDVESLERIVAMLDEDSDRLSFGRGSLGALGQGLDVIVTRNEDDQVELKSSLADEIEIDLATAVSDFSARQAAYEASLRTIANMYHLTLLDYL